MKSKNLLSSLLMVHGEYVRPSGTDGEHAMPFHDIKNNQTQLIDYLNDAANKQFADDFLKEPGINEFFRRDPNDKKIKGTGYFYKLCYNNPSNLWLLCHACNIEKTDSEVLEWFKKQENFGEPFTEALEKDGSLRMGLIFKKE